MGGDENREAQDSSDSIGECSDDLLSSGSDLFGEEEEEDDEEDEENSSPSDEPLRDMSTLLQELPFKKGLSKHYNGKSQSFSSLSSVMSLEDLAKPENPLNKKLKGCRSYGGLFLEGSKRSHSSSSSSSSKLGILKKPSTSRNGGFCSSRKNGSFFYGNHKPSHPPPPPPPPHRSVSSANFANQTPLLA